MTGSSTDKPLLPVDADAQALLAAHSSPEMLAELAAFIAGLERAPAVALAHVQQAIRMAAETEGVESGLEGLSEEAEPIPFDPSLPTAPRAPLRPPAQDRGGRAWLLSGALAGLLIAGAASVAWERAGRLIAEPPQPGPAPSAMAGAAPSVTPDATPIATPAQPPGE